MGGQDRSPQEKERDIVQHKMPTAQGGLMLDKLRDKDTLVVSEFVTANKKTEQELNINMEITETSITRKLNRRTADNNKLLAKLNSFMKPDKPEASLKEIPSVDEEVLAIHDEAVVEPDVKQVVAAEVLDAEDYAQYIPSDEAVQVQVKDAEDSDQVLAAEVLAVENDVLLFDAENSDQVLAAENSPKYNPVNVVDTVPDNTVQDLTHDETLGHQAYQDLPQDEALGHQAFQALTRDEARGHQATKNTTYSGGNHIMAAEDQALAAEDQFLAAEDQQILIAKDKVLAIEIQQVVAAEVRVKNAESSDQVLNAEDDVIILTTEVLATEVTAEVLAPEDSPGHNHVDDGDIVPAETFQALTLEEVLVAEDSPKFKPVDEGDKKVIADHRLQVLNQEENLGHQAAQDLAREEDPGLQAIQILNQEVQHVSPIQQNLVAEDLAVEENIQHVHSIQQVLIAEVHVLTRAVPHVHPTQHAKARQKDENPKHMSGDKAVGDDGDAKFQDGVEDPKLRKPPIKFGTLYLLMGMITMFLLMTTGTMTPLRGFSMTVLSNTGGNDNKYIPVHIIVTSSVTAHIHEAPAAVQDAKEVYHQVVARQHGQAVQVRDDVPTDGCDEQNQWRLVEDMEDKSETGSWRSIKPPIQDDPAHEAQNVGHGGIHAFSAEGVHGHLDGAEQEGHDPGDVRDDALTAGGDNPDQARVDEAIVNAKEADKDDTNDRIVMGSEVPNQEGGGEEDETLSGAKQTNAAHDDNDKKVVVGPTVNRVEEGEESKMTNPPLLFDNKRRSKMFKAMHESNNWEDVKYKTNHRMSDMYETFQVNVMTETFKEDVEVQRDEEGGEDDPVLWIIETGERSRLYENNYQEDKQYKTFYRMSDMYVMIKNLQENVMTATIKEDVVHKTFQKDKDAKAYMRNVVMPGAKMTLTTQHSCVTVKTGPKEDTKRVAITSERGERGGITKCATHVAGNFVAVANR